MIFARRATFAHSRLRRTVWACLFAALLLAGFAITAQAQAPTPLRVVTPFTWMQFKQQFGVIDGTNTLSLPGTPTVVAGSGQDANGGVGGTLAAGTQIESFLLGDGGVSELPIPRNFMRDVTALLGPNAVENWLAPFFNLSNSGQPLQTIDIDDNNTYNTFTNPNLTFSTIFGTYVDGTLAGAVQNSLFNPFNGTPPTGAANNANGWETAIGDPLFEQNFFLVDYRRTVNTSATTSNGLVQRADPTKNLQYNGATTVATWAFAVPNPTPPPITTTQSTAPPVTNPPNNLITNNPVAQPYDAYVWFPTEDASPLSSNPELHITDAEYTIQIVNQFTQAVIFSTTTLVDQTSGGSWVKIGGPFTVPIIVNPATGASQAAIVTISLDNTTNEFVNNTSVTQLPNYHVVANAVELRPDDGNIYGSPVVVNASDYPELIGGYQDGGVNANNVDQGGFPIGYRAATEGAAAFTNGATGVSTSGGNFFNGAVPNGEYTEDQWGDFWSNGGAAADPTAAPPASVTVIAHRPIDQVVYTTRSINIGGFQSALDQTIGAVYAIDGLTGNVIWRYPSVLPFTVDDAQTGNNIFTATGTSANQGDNWTQVNTPGTNFFATSYTRITAQSGQPTNNPPFPTATWQLPQLSREDQGYLVYAWFPTSTPGEQHIPDAHYTVGGTACNPVDQRVGGNWVQLTWDNVQLGQATDPVFVLAAGATVTLNNVTAANLGGNNEPPADTFAVADAILIVPANAPGPITSTPVVVRNMHVLVDPTTNRFSARTVVMFTDNSLGSTNGGGATTIDNAEPPNATFTSTAGFQAGAVAAPGVDHFGANYERVVPVARGTTNPGPEQATWALPLAGNQAQAYEVFVWFPSTTPTETHITDAQYTAAAIDPNSGKSVNITLDNVDQTTGGKWVQLSYVEPGTNIDTSIFYFNGASHSVTLDNSTNNANPANLFVTADAVKFVPATPAANFSGSRVYCLDAAGNADGDDTVVDQNGEPVAYNNTGALTPPAGAPAGFAFAGPLQPLHYGTTKAYWIWQPDPTKPILQANGNETPETAPDPHRDMPLPGAYLLNSPTISLAPDPNIADQFQFSYQGTTSTETPQHATLYIGNSNGVLYSVDGTGTLNNAADQLQRYQTADPNMPTVDVNWWFITGGGIAYAPALDPHTANVPSGDPTVYVTSYDPNAENLGRVWAVDAVKGPAGNQGKGDPKSAAGDFQVPGSLNYNITQVPFWSFPDGFGTVKDANGNLLPTTVHLVTSAVTGFGGTKGPALPLGDIAGAPMVYTADDGHTRVYVAANEPTPFGDGPSSNGRIYSIYADDGAGAGLTGNMAWAFPDINGNPNAVGTTDQQDATFNFNPLAAPGTLPNAPLGAFTLFDSNTGLVVSSSPVAGHVTFPANTFPATETPVPPNLGGLQDQDTPETQMLYVGATDGVLYALNLGVADDAATTGNFDVHRLIYNDPIGDGPIISTPVLLSGSATNSKTANNDVGGVVFLNSSVGDIWEIEATPLADPTGTITNAPIVNKDWGWAGPGGLSSPAVGSFDTTGFTVAGPDTTSPINPNPTRDDSEWVYSGSDNGFLYAFTPNTSTGGGFQPGNFIPIQNVGPNNNIDLTRNFMSAVYSSNPIQPGTPNTIAWDPTGAPPHDPSFEWGQTVWIAIFGVDNPAVNTGTSASPIGKYIDFTYTSHDRTGRSVQSTKRIDLSDPNTIARATTVSFPPANLATAIQNGTLNLGKNADGFYYAVVYPYTLIPGKSDTNPSGDPLTPGPDIQITHIQEVAIANNQQVTITGSSSGPTIVNTGTGGTSTYGLVPMIDQASFGILNPLGIAGAGTELGGGQTNIVLSPTGVAVPAQALGPFTAVDATQVATFPSPTGWQLADSNGNAVPLTPPVGGTQTNPTTGLPIDPTQSLSSQGLALALPQITIAADAGEIAHGSTGDTGTGVQQNPQANNIPVPTPGGTYGESYLNVADRSALGSVGQVIANLRMDSPLLGWNDNSINSQGTFAPNSVINMMPWDFAPQSVKSTTANVSPDYPNIPEGNIHVQMIPRSENLPGDPYNGTQGDVTTGDEQLANANGPLLTRTIRPNAVTVQVAVPRYQPANLETDDVSAFRVGGERSHVQNNAAGSAGRVPEGYLASVKVFVDTGGAGSVAGKWDQSKAYRVVQVWVGVPADMSTAIGQQTTDIGSVPAGFGLWNPNNVSAVGPPITPGAWSPYALSGASGLPLYRPWYLSVPVYNTGNVNLLNVHFDQNVDLLNLVNSTFTSQPLLMLSDTVANQPTNGQPIWPFLDTTGAYTGTAGLPIVRTSLDEDVYMQAGLAGTLNPTEGPVPGPTAHKARPGEPAPGEPIKLPDEPHDFTSPFFVNPQPYPSHFYNGDPAVSIAVPLGTPVGSYSETLRTFEGSDVPFNPWIGPQYGGAYYSPGLWNNAANSQYAFVLNSANNTPLQFFSDPGTVLKAKVIEDRITDDTPILSNLSAPSGVDYEPSSLSMLDPSRLLGAGANANPLVTLPHSNDIQPAAFRDVTSAGGLANGGFGLLWPSQRDFITNKKTPIDYDIFAASLANPAATGTLSMPTAPAGGTSGAWWVGLNNLANNKIGPDDITQNSGAAQPFTSYNPYIVTPNLSPGAFSGDPNTALRVDSLQGGAPSYTIKYFQFTGSTEPALDPSGAATPAWLPLAPSSSAPIFAPRGVYVDNATTLIAQPLILFWSATSGGRSQIYYQSPHATSGSNPSNIDGYPLILPQAPANAPTASAATLQLPASITSASNPTPVARPFTYSWPDGKGNIQQWPVIDVTYSGVSTLTGQTDIYTSRYIIWQSDPTVHNDPVNDPLKLLPVPFYVSGTTNASFTETPETETLTPNASGTTWEAQDVGWVRDLTRFSLGYIPANTGAYQAIINNGAPALTTLPIYDRSSGQWVFHNVTLPWLAGPTTTGTVYVNPDQGTVSFSTPPPATQPGGGGTAIAPLVVAQFVPQALRATIHSGTNTAPIAFIDDAFKPNTLVLPGQPQANQPPTVLASRYWYIWRKSSAAAGGAASTASTLYFKTKRLTVVLKWPIGYTGNPNNPNAIVPLPVVTVTIPGVGPQPVSNLVDISPGHYIQQNQQPSSGVPQMVPGRIFFPDSITVGGVNYSTEGLAVSVNYTAAPYENNSGAPVSPGPQQETGNIQWLDEPYANSPTDTAFRSGERAIPINSSINEGEPSAFLDPDAYQNGVGNFGGATPTAPISHRIWLFWVSTRSAPDAANGGPQGTGSDVYSEALDPRFSDTTSP